LTLWGIVCTVVTRLNFIHFKHNKMWKKSREALYTHLVPGRTPLCLQNSLNSTRCRKHSTGMLVHADATASCSFCRLDSGILVLQTARSISSQRCSMWLRSGECAGHSSKLNTLSCSRQCFPLLNCPLQPIGDKDQLVVHSKMPFCTPLLYYSIICPTTLSRFAHSNFQSNSN
jgi:hypothetical protein